MGLPMVMFGSRPNRSISSLSPANSKTRCNWYRCWDCAWRSPDASADLLARARRSTPDGWAPVWRALRSKDTMMPFR